MAPPGFTRPTDGKLSSWVAKGHAADNFRCSLMGNGFRIGIVAWLLSQMLRSHGLIACQVTLTQIGCCFMAVQDFGFISMERLAAHQCT